jgi:signal transduction histidine kinase
MLRRLVVTYLAITMFGLALLAVPLGITFAHREKDRLLFDVERDAVVMSELTQGALDSGTPLPFDDIQRYSRQSGGHVIIVNSSGIALADTEQPTRHLDYSTRPEIAHALAGSHDTGTRHSNTLRTTLVYSAVPIVNRSAVIGAVRITYETKTLDARIQRTWAQLALLCLGVLLIVAAVGFVLARSITLPIRRLQAATDAFGVGVLSARVESTDKGPPEVRNLAATFNRMADRLATVLEAQQRFVADASHQLRTPLTALRLRLENLASRGDERDHAALAAAIAEVGRMSRVVDGLLLLARDDAKLPATEVVDLAATARDRVDIWREVAADREIAVEAEAPRNGVWTRVLAGAAEQLVDNLVDNALAVSPARGRITVRVESGGAGVELHVVDEGPGLDTLARERAFDRFWRAPDATPGGSGLGLAIVRRLAEASGGRARLDTAPGGGIDAVVVLPAAPEPRPQVPDAVATGAPD